jgi:hypothetical protein
MTKRCHHHGSIAVQLERMEFRPGPLLRASEIADGTDDFDWGATQVYLGLVEEYENGGREDATK